MHSNIELRKEEANKGKTSRVIDTTCYQLITRLLVLLLAPSRGRIRYVFKTPQYIACS